MDSRAFCAKMIDPEPGRPFPRRSRWSDYHSDLLAGTFTPFIRLSPCASRFVINFSPGVYHSVRKKARFFLCIPKINNSNIHPGRPPRRQQSSLRQTKLYRAVKSGRSFPCQDKRLLIRRFLHKGLLICSFLGIFQVLLVQRGEIKHHGYIRAVLRLPGFPLMSQKKRQRQWPRRRPPKPGVSEPWL